MTRDATEPGAGPLPTEASSGEHPLVTDTVEDAHEPARRPKSPQLSVSARAGLEDMRRRLGIGAATPPRVGRDARYELHECLGRGGMGEVYRAHDTLLERDVALKVVAAKNRQSSHLRGRLLREAQALAKLQHPNVLDVHDVDIAESGELIIVVSLVRGTTLEQWQRGQQLAATLPMYLQAGRGLAAAHAAGIVHRDFKPANVLIDAAGERVVVGDFGLAAEIQAESVRPRDAKVLGTAPYLAPELLDGAPASFHTDQFAFGVSLWEAATGSLPFRGLDRELPQRPSNLPRWLYRALRRMLAEAPSARYPSMSEALLALQRGLARPRRVMVGSAAIMVASLFAWSAWPPRADTCEPLASSWSKARHDELRGLEGGAFAIEVFDASAARLVERAERHCEREDRTSSAALHEQHCLEAWRDELERRITAFAGSGDLALLELRDLEACSVTTPVLEAAVREQLGRAETARLGLDLDAATRATDEALALAPARGPGCAEQASLERAAASLERARIEAARADVEAARAAGTQALDDLLLCGDTGELFVRTSIEQAKLLALDLDEPGSSALLLEFAAMSLNRLGSEDHGWLAEQLALSWGLVALAEARPAQAIGHFEHALGMLGNTPGEQLERAKLHIDLAGAHALAGDDRAALRHYELASGVIEDSLGERHPESRRYRAFVLIGRSIAGDSEATDALAALVDQLDDPLVRARALLVLSRELDAREPARALAYALQLADALARLDTNIPPRELAEMLTEAGQMLAALDPARSVAMLERALALWTGLEEPDNRDLAELCLAEALLALGRTRAAWVHASALVDRRVSTDIRTLALQVVDRAARELAPTDGS